MNEHARDPAGNSRGGNWRRPLCLLLGGFALAIALSGCVVVPARPYWHPYHYGYY